MSTLPENSAPAMTPNPSRVYSGARSSESDAYRPSAWSGISLIVKRELGTYFRSLSGYVIFSLLLLLDGLFFNIFAVSSTAKFSTDVLADFLFWTSGVVCTVAVFLSMRLIAEDRETGALPLLTTSSLSDGEIVVAKFISGFLFLAVFIAVTIYMPLLIFINGKVSLGHIVGGYFGLLCIGSAAFAIGTFGSAIAPSQIVAGIISGSIVVFLVIEWSLARLVDGALGDVFSYLALHDKHFRPFMDGTVSLRDVVFYLSVTMFFLVLARNSLEARRWKP
jgi:gliding motility-associated transport system permease protein